jgi:NitT/TauT family transport system substrate-binding protein
MRHVARVYWVGLLIALLACQPAAPPAAPASQPAAPAPAAGGGAASSAPAPAAGAPAASAGALPAGGAAAAPAAAPATTGMPRALDPPVAVRVGLLSSVSDSGVYIGYERGYYRELGLDLQLETVADPNTISTLLGTNQLDVGGLGVNANPYQAAARGINVKIVADKGSLRPGFGYLSLLGRQDLMDSGQLRTRADLRGRTLTRLAPCDSSDPPFEKLFQSGGFTRDEIEFATMPFPEVNVALGNKAVDLGFQLEPLATVAVERGIASRILTFDEVYPNQQIAALFYSPDFVARTDAAQRFMVAYIRSLRDYNGAFAKNRGRAEVAQILAKHTTVKDLALYDRIIPAGLDPDGRLNVPGMREDLTVFSRLNCVTGEIADVSRVVDESFVNYALGVLGPY